MGSTERIAELRRAASAAEARAVECHQRLEGLRSISRVTECDARRAGQRLADATVRAETATRRLAAVRRAHAERRIVRAIAVQVAELPARLDDLDAASMGGRLRRSAREDPSSVGQLWLGFARSGGTCGFLEFDAYVNGAWTMPLADRVVLQQVVWGREHGDELD